MILEVPSTSIKGLASPCLFSKAIGILHFGGHCWAMLHGTVGHLVGSLRLASIC
jgi:hypothetical protein